MVPVASLVPLVERQGVANTAAVLAERRSNKEQSYLLLPVFPLSYLGRNYRKMERESGKEAFLRCA